MTTAIVARNARDARETSRNLMLNRPGSWVYVDTEEGIRGWRVERVVWVEGWQQGRATVATLRALELRRTPTCTDLVLPEPMAFDLALERARQAADDLEAQRSWGKPPASPFVSPESITVEVTRPRRRRSVLQWLRGER